MVNHFTRGVNTILKLHQRLNSETMGTDVTNMAIMDNWARDYCTCDLGRVSLHQSLAILLFVQGKATWIGSVMVGIFTVPFPIRTAINLIAARHHHFLVTISTRSNIHIILGMCHRSISPYVYVYR